MADLHRLLRLSVFIAVCPAFLWCQADSLAKKALDRGSRYFFRGNYDSAAHYLNLALSGDSSTLEAYDYLAQCHSELGNCQDAFETFRLGLKRDSNNTSLLTHAAQITFQCGALSASESYYRRLVTLHPRQVKSIVGISQIFIQQTSYDSAITYLQNGLTADSTSLQLHYLLGYCYFVKKKDEPAIRELATAVDKNPAYFPAVRDLAFAYLQADSLVYATRGFQLAQSIQPENLNIRMNLGNCYFRMKEYEKALPVYAGLEGTAYMGNTCVQEGLCYYYLGKYDSAIVKFLTASRIDSMAPGTYFNLGLSYMELRKYKMAINAFKRAVRYSKSELTTNSLDRMGAVYYELKAKEKALRSYKMALDHDPRVARVHFDMGVLYENLYRDTQKAIDCYQHVLALAERSKDPGSLYQKARLRLKFLRGKR